VSSTVPAGDDWAFEVKWEWMRVVAAVDPTAPPRRAAPTGSMSGVRFPELADWPPRSAGGRRVSRRVVVLDAKGRLGLPVPCRSRMHVNGPTGWPGSLPARPVTFVVFDLLVLDGTSYSRSPIPIAASCSST